jgi:hypothetical protein
MSEGRLSCRDWRVLAVSAPEYTGDAGTGVKVPLLEVAVSFELGSRSLAVVFRGVKITAADNTSAEMTRSAGTWNLKAVVDDDQRVRRLLRRALRDLSPATLKPADSLRKILLTERV